MKKVMVFGTFDVFHKGHLFLFEQAKKYGDTLIVVVAKDATVQKLKGMQPKHTEQERLAQVENAPGVDAAMLGKDADYYAVIADEQPSVICLGYDQTLVPLTTEKLQEIGSDAEIIRLPAYKEDIYKSSKIKAAEYKD